MNKEPENLRLFFGDIYLKGEGIEIGALHNPLRTPASCKVKYVDLLNQKELQENFKVNFEKGGYDINRIVYVDIIDDGAVLSTLPDSSQDFVIANHMLEHVENPILAFQNMLRVTRSSGIVFLSIPNKEETFDKDREVTSLAHIIRDYEEGVLWSRRDHYIDWRTNVDKVPIDEADIERLCAGAPNIHFHTWDPKSLLDFFNYLVHKFNIIIKAFVNQRNEYVVIIEKK
jgi:SAM-dependent methyltransferase